MTDDAIIQIADSSGWILSEDQVEMGDLCILYLFKPIQTYKAQNMGMSILINFIIPIINPENISKMKNTINIVKTFKKIGETFPRK